MIIYLTKSKLFNTDPDLRFANEYAVPIGLWRELWRKHKLMGYSVSDLRDYFELKTKQQTNTKTINRWIIRSEIYMIAKNFRDKGAETVVSSVFQNYEQEVIDELTKQLRWGGSKESRNMV